MTGIGHNNPPNATDVVRDLNEKLLAELEIKNGDLSERKKALDERTLSAPEIITDENQGDVSSILKDFRDLNKDVEGRRQYVKEPVLKAGSVIDGFFKAGFEKPINSAMSMLQTRLNKYVQEKEAAERKRREEEAERLRQEEKKKRDEAARLAEEMATKADLRTAVAIENQAKNLAGQAARMEKSANASAADLVRTRTTTGVLLTAKEERRIGIPDDLGQIDYNKLKPYLKRDAVEAAIRKAVLSGVSASEFPGVTDTTEKVASVR